MRRAGPLRRCLGEFVPCGGICIYLFSFYIMHFVVFAVFDCHEIYHGLYSRVVRLCFVACPVCKYCAKEKKCAECFFECAFERRATRFHPGVDNTFSHLFFTARALRAGGSSRSGYPRRIRFRRTGTYLSLSIYLLCISHNNNNNNNLLQHPGNGVLGVVLQTRL